MVEDKNSNFELGFKIEIGLHYKYEAFKFKNNFL
jgi:hypothetical protein